MQCNSLYSDSNSDNNISNDVIPDVLTGVSNSSKCISSSKLYDSTLESKIKEKSYLKEDCDDVDIEVYSLDNYFENINEKTSQSHKYKNDRDNVRRKLAMLVDEDYFDDTQSKIMFMNEAVNDFDDEMVESLLSKKLCINKPDVIPFDKNCESFPERKERLQKEAKLALAQVGSLAHMQLMLEKKNKKQSNRDCLLKGSMMDSGEFNRLKCSRAYLQTLNVGQLQVLVNSIHTEIEELNVELMKLLVERDELHMAQDSMLVDIQDLTGLAQEYCSKEAIKYNHEITKS